MHISRGADTGLSVHWSVHCSLLKILWFVLSHYSDFDICGLMWNVWTNIRWITMVFSADIDAPLKMNRYNFPRLFSWACFIHPIKLSHQIQCIQLSVWYLILLKHQQQHKVWLMWIRSGSLNVFLVVMLNSDCSLHTSEESIDTTVKQSPSYLPVHNFPFPIFWNRRAMKLDGVLLLCLPKKKFSETLQLIGLKLFHRLLLSVV